MGLRDPLLQEVEGDLNIHMGAGGEEVEEEKATLMIDPKAVNKATGGQMCDIIFFIYIYV